MRGQVGTETLMVIGLAVVLIMAVIYTVLPMVFDFTAYSENSNIETSLFKIKGTIESVSSFGPGTNTQVMLYFPEGNLRGDGNKLIFVKSNGDSILTQVDVPFTMSRKNTITGMNTFTIIKPDEIDKEVSVE